MRFTDTLIATVCLGALAMPSHAAPKPESGILQPVDIFEMEYASDPRISRNGKRVVYVRNTMDIMADRRRSRLWMVNFEGTDNRPLVAGEQDVFFPRWSPDGKRLAYLAAADGKAQIFLRWMDTGQTARLSHLQHPPSGLAWSPDGKWLAFSMFVPDPAPPLVHMPDKPKGAVWAKPPRVIRQVKYRADGTGFLEEGYSQLFVLPAEGGTPRQITSGPFNHGGQIAWTPDAAALIVSANRHEDWPLNPRDSEISEVRVADGAIEALTDRRGPDTSPVVSPDGRLIAYLGFDDHLQGYQVTHLYVMRRDGSDRRLVTGRLDRDVRQPRWNSNSAGLYFQYDDQGDTKLAYISLDGHQENLGEHLGSASIGRPYSGASFTVAPDGHVAATVTRPERPADVAVGRRGISSLRVVTHLNDDLLDDKRLGRVEEIRFASGYDQWPLQGWIVYPPDFDGSRQYPMILEIHGGPFANYGDRFSAEIQLYAAAGYVVLYLNPRGSTSYGEEFGNLIHHAYPGHDYDDLMSGVDAVLQRGFVDADNLFVTGGSGGGVLSSWIVGKTDRFRAAVVAKPVINWTSFMLTSDIYNSVYQYWFAKLPWEDPAQYLARSPLSLVGNVTTPTMLLTGEQDHRTPISESEQFYQALKLRKIETALVRIQESGHGIARKPSNLIAKVLHVLAWFEGHRKKAP
ncbi:MAG: prolyl oligopeptidase family serine peptidase [Acidobacteriota bacterium]